MSWLVPTESPVRSLYSLKRTPSLKIIKLNILSAVATEGVMSTNKVLFALFILLEYLFTPLPGGLVKEVLALFKAEPADHADCVMNDFNWYVAESYQTSPAVPGSGSAARYFTLRPLSSV